MYLFYCVWAQQQRKNDHISSTIQSSLSISMVKQHWDGWKCVCVKENNFNLFYCNTKGLGKRNGVKWSDVKKETKVNNFLRFRVLLLLKESHSFINCLSFKFGFSDFIRIFPTHNIQIGHQMRWNCMSLCNPTTNWLVKVFEMPKMLMPMPYWAEGFFFLFSVRWVDDIFTMHGMHIGHSTYTRAW